MVFHTDLGVHFINNIMQPMAMGYTYNYTVTGNRSILTPFQIQGFLSATLSSKLKYVVLSDAVMVQCQTYTVTVLAFIVSVTLLKF